MTIRDAIIDELLSGEDPQAVFAKDGLLEALKKALAERILDAELEHHLRGERAQAGRGTPRNHRNGHSRKTMLSGSGKLEIAVPRDRQASFEPQLIAKYRRRFPDFDDKVISLYARGLSMREIEGHLRDLYGIEVSPELISTVTDAVHEQVTEWQNRPLEPLYALVFFDALRVKVRDEGMVCVSACNFDPVSRGDRRPTDARCGSARSVDRAERVRQVLAAGDERVAHPRCRTC